MQTNRSTDARVGISWTKCHLICRLHGRACGRQSMRSSRTPIRKTNRTRYSRVHRLSTLVEFLESRLLLSATYNLTDLGPGQANGINASGQVVGQTDYATWGTIHAFLYSNGTKIDLGNGGFESFAYAINASGQVVGGFMTPSGNGSIFSFL